MTFQSAVLTTMLCLSALAGFGGSLSGADDVRKDAILRLASGDYITGSLGDSATPDVVTWNSPLFTKPLTFPAGRVVSVHFPVGLDRPAPTGAYCVELAGGDQLFGELVSLSPTEMVLDSTRFGKLKIARSHIRRILSWGEGAKVIWQGPNGLGGWDHSGETAKWTEEGGQLVTNNQDAFLQRDLDLPSRAGIELEISWKKKADFVIALGVDDNPKNIQQAFRLEVWEQDLVLMRETDDEVDVTSLLKLKAGDGQLHLQIYLDQEKNRIFAYTADGRRLGDLEVAKSNSPAAFTLAGLRVMNKRGDLRLDRLRITEWNGEAPHDVQGNASRAHLADGTIINGNVQSYDAETHEFIILSDDKPVRIKEGQAVSFSMPAETPEEPRVMSAIFPDNNRISGSIVKIEKGKMSIKCPGIENELVFPATDLHSLASTDKQLPPQAHEEREGRLEIPGLRLRGYLVDAQAEADGSCLMFHPREGLSSSPLRADASGRIVYRDPPPPQPKKPVQQQRRRVVRQRRGFWGGVIEKLSTGNSPGAVSGPSGRAIHLYTGDVIPGKVKRIDEKGVYFDSTMTDAKFVPNEKVKAVEFVRAQSTIKFNKKKRERLLTLPRMQKHNPPTHMIRSIKGDYLRARILDMDEEYLTVEVRLETKKIRREYVSRIIWLHGDDLNLDESADEDPVEKPPAKLRVQTMRSDSSRLTFEPSEVTNATISGASDVLGQCQVEIKVVDQLIFGDAIEEAASQLTYHQWKLKHAVEPSYLSASGGQNTGLDSALVGEMAPDFTLKLMQGGDFHLADQKGKIIILDFWATWCGPCMQAMPQVDGVAREFEGQQVELITVNLEENPERISQTLERLKLSPTVALDQDGAVADKYSATSIPQTVIIDRDGKIARLFIGGGPQFGEQLRKALQEVISGKLPGEDPPADAQPAADEQPTPKEESAADDDSATE
ncbi:Thiol-disulfide oxidoreductase ResA [Symmachiella dynata]|uniref:TlpA family protein disulfide reductase n=1 Tax=Symmachiella dynata TaxID=2527995 RepID=UPI00118AC518|nr:TlpA disulfide reductase family protein [Symmachiella dynata]QDT46115.1 Thiol-disulfide oxidoreductase ResA [Symmachiella dynata]